MIYVRSGQNCGLSGSDQDRGQTKTGVRQGSGLSSRKENANMDRMSTYLAALCSSIFRFWRIASAVPEYQLLPVHIRGGIFLRALHLFQTLLGSDCIIGSVKIGLVKYQSPELIVRDSSQPGYTT